MKIAFRFSESGARLIRDEVFRHEGWDLFETHNVVQLERFFNDLLSRPCFDFDFESMTSVDLEMKDTEGEIYFITFRPQHFLYTEQ